MGRFEGKGVIVTGAGRGIGQATAGRFASEGADVMLIGRTPRAAGGDRRADPRRGGQGLGAPVRRVRRRDVHGAVAAARAQWRGRIDVLVNNAGIDDETPFLEMDRASLARGRGHEPDRAVPDVARGGAGDGATRAAG